jgi:hypothetical protein
MVEWDPRRQSLAVGDQECDDQPISCVYWLKRSAHQWIVDGVTMLQGSDGNPVCDLIQGAINLQDDKIVGADSELPQSCSHSSTAVYRWDLQSGSPVNSVSIDGAGFGAAISQPAQ